MEIAEAVQASWAGVQRTGGHARADVILGLGQLISLGSDERSTNTPSLGAGFTGSSWLPADPRSVRRLHRLNERVVLLVALRDQRRSAAQI
ncbi:hypothetical protein F8G81_09605 [Arthrobacter sp. CDRTa11]|uniref:hypothetical protein n=1 Tax=Arthrobacter sp. CDRTa11 TaxID=2651199 RepID=UPI002265BA1C|nr:hypothetical protein [Arthrobacter sp. CDRTa11]UZX02836.1 hypothetical protein F8G81_09605 [Arthrobacter sp. CDRTa11]